MGFSQLGLGCLYPGKIQGAFLLCRDDAAEANFEYVYYASPVIPVVENMSDEDRQNEAINPPTEVIERCEIYRTLNDDETELLNTLWQELKGN